MPFRSFISLLSYQPVFHLGIMSNKSARQASEFKAFFFFPFGYYNGSFSSLTMLLGIQLRPFKPNVETDSRITLEM